MAYELAFRVMVNAELNSILSIIQNDFESINTDSHNSFIAGRNRIEIVMNEDYDSNLTADPEDGYLYYKYLLAVYPISEDVSLDEQVRLSQKMLQTFSNQGIMAEIVADFEKLL
jgi:hypothetical protein